MKNNIGIFIAFPLQQSKNHGISRLLSFILADMVKNPDMQVFIATPIWFENETIDFLKDHSFHNKRIKLLTTSKIPFYSHLMQFLLEKKSVEKKTDRIKKSTHGKFVFLIKKYLINSLLVLGSIIISLVIIYPLRLIKRIFSALNRHLRNFLGRYRFVRHVLAPLVRAGYRWNKRILRFVYRRLRRLVSSSQIIKICLSPKAALKRSFLLRATYTELRARELARLIRIINSRTDISVWYTPALFWPEIRHIQAKKVIAVPDIVAVDFPQHFSSHTDQQTTRRMTESLAAGDHFICYSDHVKQKHLVEPFAIDPNKISVIPHAPVDLNQAIQSDGVGKCGALQRDEAIRILNAYQKRAPRHHPYLADYNLADMRFIFYSSQIRPYKNFHLLIRAYEILLRDRFVNIKLVLTGNIKSDPILYQMIQDKRLQFDVLSFHNVTPDVLAALNHLAICAVNPTLFEGGFPFTFTEAFSVGTPSVMSAIPAVLAEIEDENLRSHMLFDPYNLDEMVNKIEWAVKHRDQLLAWQLPLYETFSRRDWSLVAKEYSDLFTHLAKSDYAI